MTTGTSPEAGAAVRGDRKVGGRKMENHEAIANDQQHQEKLALQRSPQPELTAQMRQSIVQCCGPLRGGNNKHQEGNRNKSTEPITQNEWQEPGSEARQREEKRADSTEHLKKIGTNNKMNNHLDKFKYQ